MPTHNSDDIRTNRKMCMYRLELTREQSEKLFSPIEEHSKLHFYRIGLLLYVNKDRIVNEFIQDTNIKIDKIFGLDSNTIDIWYTRYIGKW